MIARAKESNAKRSRSVHPSPLARPDVAAVSLARVIIVPHSANSGAHTFCA
jgi:hypothetical protein